jgi:CHAT domain-containing protein
LFARLTCNEYDVIHFACHAMVNYARPALSYLELARNERCYLADLLHECDCRGAGVVLSACDSTVAAVSRVDLKNSLADAFYFSGASSVIGSLWPLEDSAASSFITHLYNTAASGFSLTSAFHRAFREFGRSMKAENWPSRYWGAFTIGVVDN